MNIKLLNNPNYQKGYFEGSQLVDNIANTCYITLEGGITAKNKEILDLKDKYNWSDEHSEITEKIGIIAAWEDAIQLKNKK